MVRSSGASSSRLAGGARRRSKEDWHSSSNLWPKWWVIDSKSCKPREIALRTRKTSLTCPHWLRTSLTWSFEIALSDHLSNHLLSTLQHYHCCEFVLRENWFKQTCNVFKTSAISDCIWYWEPAKMEAICPANACSLSIPGSFRGASRMLHGCFTGASRVFHGCFTGCSRHKTNFSGL